MFLGFAVVFVNRQISSNSYEFFQIIGEGIFFKVKLVWYILIGLEVIMKVFQKIEQSFFRIKKFFYEVYSLRVLNFLNIIKLFEVIDIKEILFFIIQYVSGKTCQIIQ